MTVRHRVWVAAALSVGLLLGTVVSVTPARADDGTASYDTLRTGWDPNEPNLSPADVSEPDFGQLFSTALDGEVYAQPVVADGVDDGVTTDGGVLLAVTDNDYVYGLDPVTGAIVWSRSVGTPWPASYIDCGDLVPNIGITSTPVYDAASQTAYFMSKVNLSTTADDPEWYLHAIDIVTGAERPGFPTMISGSPTNDPTDTFNPITAMQRPGLLLLDGVVYAGFASLCDHGPYVGYVVGVNATTGAQTTLWSSEGSSASSEAGIWQSGGGLVSDGDNRILLTTGNGVSPPPGPGNDPPGNLAESVILLAVNPNGSLTAKDFFSPTNNTQLDAQDADLGSGGPLALPAGFGTAAHPNLLVQIGKDGRVFLLDRDNLGGMGQGPDGTNDALQTLGPYNGVWGHPAFWGGDGGYVYSIENGGYLRAFQYGVAANGLPSLTSVGTSAGTWGEFSGSPVVTSDGTTDGSALVWGVYAEGASGTGGELRAYDAVPVDGIMQEVWSAPIGTASKFAIPATDQGRVYVGTRDGNLMGFGEPTTAALEGSPTQFGSVQVGTSTQTTATVTATAPVTVDSVSTSSPFGIGTPNPLPSPQTLTTGESLSVPVTFLPTTAGVVSGSLSFTTSAGPLAFGLDGTGTQPGLDSTPPSLNFGDVPVGSTSTASAGVANTGIDTETVTGSTPPSAPFTTTGMPATGTTLAPQGSVTIPVTFAPTKAGAFTDTLTVDSNAGDVTVDLTGTGVTGAAHLTLTPTSLNYGTVTIGKSLTKSFDISNTGNLVLTLTKAAPPAGVFATSTPVSEGQQLSPGDVIIQSVTFTPTAVGPASAVYTINGNDSEGAQQEILTGSGVANLPSEDGYWAVAGDGGVFSFGDAPFYGSMGGHHLDQPIVGMAATPSGHGYYLVAADGGIFAFGDARFYGSMGGHHLDQPIVGMTVTPTGRGYTLVAKDGGIFAFGDARFYGSMGGHHLDQPIVGMTATPTGRGYTLVAADGGIFAFGDARFYGSMGGRHLDRPVVAMIAATDGMGYTEIAADGGVFTFGPHAPYFGSVPGLGVSTSDVVGGAVLARGGYSEIAGSGTSYWFTSSTIYGTETLGKLDRPLVGGAGRPA